MKKLLKKAMWNSILVVTLFTAIEANGQNGQLRVADLDYESVQLYGCNQMVEVPRGESRFDFGQCRVIDSVRLTGKDELVFDEYQWKMNDNEVFINIALSYVDIDNSYSIIFHNEKSIVWLVYEMNGEKEWNSLIITNCNGDNSHKKLTEKRIQPLAHVPEEYMHR